MKYRNELSAGGIILIGIVIALICCGLFYLCKQLVAHGASNVKNAEKYLAHGKLEEAAAVALQIPEDDCGKYLVLGKILFARSLIEQNEGRWRTYGSDANDWLKDEAADSAVTFFEKALSCENDAASAKYYIGRIYMEKGWYEKAENELFTVVEQDSLNSNARVALGVLYTRMHRPDEALIQLKNAVAVNPDNSQANKNIAFIYRFHKEMPESAMVWFARYLHSARSGDIDVTTARMELDQLKRRYPEYITPEVEHAGLKQKKRFVSRHAPVQ